jgi:hypothetical protein
VYAHGGQNEAMTGRVPDAHAAIAQARTCYDHLAGRLGVGVTEGMIRAGLLRHRAGRPGQAGDLAVTDAGLAWLTGTLGVDEASLHRTRRPLARTCLDWTERRPHLAGAAGAAVCRRFLERGWVVRVDGSRAVSLTPAGAVALPGLLDVDPATWA